jgi:hypothetical protein
MEKRNFVTTLRTSGESSGLDGMVEEAAGLFGGDGGAREKKAESDFAKRASAEDEKTDSLS